MDNNEINASSTVDTPEFRTLMRLIHDSSNFDDDALDQAVTFLDAHTARAVADAYAKGRSSNCLTCNMLFMPQTVR